MIALLDKEDYKPTPKLYVFDNKIIGGGDVCAFCWKPMIKEHPGNIMMIDWCLFAYHINCDEDKN